MTDAQDAKAEDPGHSYMRLPWPLVAAGLFGLLVLVLAAGLFANRYLRPQVGLVPTEVPLAAAAASPTPLPATAVAATPGVVLARTPLIIGTVAPPTATGAPATAAVSTPMPELPPVMSSTPSPLPTVEPALAEEVGRAYELFWRVRTQALLELDETHLPEVMDAEYLVTFKRTMARLRAENRAIKTRVVLNYFVIAASQDSANVVDDIEDNSVYVRIGTEDPLTSPTADQLRVLYSLSKSLGIWKVVDSVRSE
jgi:hypothetical protein